MKLSKKNLDDIELIMSHLEDDESKKCFKYRLLYSITGNIQYIFDMVSEYRLDSQEIILQSEKANRYYGLYKNCDLLSFLLKKYNDYIYKIVIFGAGYWGKLLYYWLTNLGFKIEMICDNFADEYLFIDGLNVKRAAEIKEVENPLVIIAVEKYTEIIKKQLLELKIDENNIYEYEKNWLLSYRGYPYFSEEIFEARDNEVFVDAGAFGGETALQFSEWAKDYKAIYSFEPDLKNYNRMKTIIEDAKVRDISMYNVGLWSENSTLNFLRAGDDGTGSYITDEGNESIKVVSLDKVLSDVEITYIKMDIEGSELNALKGAQNIILKNKPRLAICLYHKPQDIIEIPQYLLELVPEYKFKIRHYTTYIYDTILYAYI